MVHGGDGDIKRLFQFKGPAAPHFKSSRESQTSSQQEGVSVGPDQRAVSLPTGHHMFCLLGLNSGPGTGRGLRQLSGKLRPRDPNRGFWMRMTFRPNSTDCLPDGTRVQDCRMAKH